MKHRQGFGIYSLAIIVIIILSSWRLRPLQNNSHRMSYVFNIKLLLIRTCRLDPNDI